MEQHWRLKFNDLKQQPQAKKLVHFWVGKESKDTIRKEVISVEDEVGKFDDNWSINSGRIWGERLYLKHKPTDEREGRVPQERDGDLLTVFVRLKAPDSDDFTYSKLRSLEIGSGQYSFVDQCEDLKVVLVKKSGLSLELHVTDCD